MRKSVLVLMLLFFFLGQIKAQADSSEVLNAVHEFEKALVDKNEELIKKRTVETLIFGHSNGWVQDKKAVLDDMRSGHLSYLRMEPSSIKIRMQGKKAVVEESVEVEAKLDSTQVKLKLFVLQYWEKRNGVWKLVLRQSAKQS